MRVDTLRPAAIRRFGLRKKERGATAVLVALMMVALLGMAAVSVDFAVTSGEKASVQNAADQAVLALATDCSLKKPTCLPSTATFYGQQNAGADPGRCLSAAEGQEDSSQDRQTRPYCRSWSRHGSRLCVTRPANSL